MPDQRDRISARAHELWVLRGRPEGSPEVDWLNAESEIKERAAETDLPRDSVDNSLREAPEVDRARSPNPRPAVRTETSVPDGSKSKRPRAGRNGAPKNSPN
jgi:hypothetical protein